MNDGTVILTALGLVGAIIGLVGTILKLVVQPLFKLLEANTKAQNKNAESQKETADNIGALVAETRKGNEEAAQRNGHLGELQLKSQELITEHSREVTVLAEGIMKKLDTQNVGTLNVAKANVDEEVVRSQTVGERVE